jgi:peptide chain release factor
LERYEAWFQVSAGHGPAECAWAVLQATEKIIAEARESGIDVRTLAVEPGPKPGTAQSALLALVSGAPLDDFVRGWQGTVRWIAQSPFRPEHKRKNWFVGVESFKPVPPVRFDLSDLRFETMCASGPGGQHVNRTESAVRVTHLPSGLQATASEERSQYRNKALAIARLGRKLDELESRQRGRAREDRWRAHQALERGNPVRVYRNK